MNRILLIRHGSSADTRRAAFPSTAGSAASNGCAPLDSTGVAQARALRGRLPTAERVWSSFAVRAAQTADLAGLGEFEAVAELAECDFGAWAGRDPHEVHDIDPTALATWYADPDAAPHGGETLLAVRARALILLERAATLGGTTIAVTHGGLIKSALLEVLELPSTAVWRLDAAPGSVTELHVTHQGTGRSKTESGTWRLVRLNWTPELARARAGIPS